MAGPAFTVKVSGLAEVRSALGELGPQADKLIRTRTLAAAASIAGVVRTAIPHATGAAAGSVKTGMDQRGAWVSEGSGIPYMAFLDFGGTTGPGHKQGPGKGSVYRQFVREGRYIYPAIMAAMPATMKAIDAAIAEAAQALGFDTDGDGTKT